MTPVLFKYPFDSSGEAPENLVLGESKDLTPLHNLKYRAFVLNAGYFYNDTVVVRDDNGVELKYGVDYHPALLHHEVAKITGLTASAVIVIDNPRVGGRVHVDYQAVGGEYSRLSDGLKQVIHTLSRDTRPVQWGSVKGKPASFRAAGHLHGVWEIYGFDPYVEQTLRVIDGLFRVDRQAIDGMREQAEDKFTAIDTQRAALKAWLEEHKNDFNNPHRVTKAQVGLGLVENHPIATESQARGLALNEYYLTPLRTQQGIDEGFGIDFRSHLADYHNPHHVSPDQVGAYSYRNADQLLGNKLNFDATAVDTLRLDGMLYSTVYNNSRSNLPASSVNTGRFHQNRLGVGTANQQMVLLGDGRWHTIQSLFDRFGTNPPSVYYVGYMGNRSAALSHVNSTYGNINQYPIGTIVIFRLRYSQWNSTGNGGITTNLDLMEAAIRTASGWRSP